jgi:biopolymer transport protein ExbB
MSGEQPLSCAALTCAPMHRVLAALLAVAALLALPAAAMAQSAGDEQYVDPFQGGEQQPAQPPQEAPAAPTEPAPAEPAPAAPSTSSAESQETVAPAQSEAPSLPRTGFPVVLVLSAGYALMLAGVAMRRKL